MSRNYEYTQDAGRIFSEYNHSRIFCQWALYSLSVLKSAQEQINEDIPQHWNVWPWESIPLPCSVGSAVMQKGQGMETT